MVKRINIICRTIKSNYIKAKPNIKTVKLINELYKKNKIIIFTARYMGRNKENVIKTKMQGYSKTLKQFKKWGLNFHELKFGKPSFDYVIDDKSIFFKKSWHKLLRKFI